MLDTTTNASAPLVQTWRVRTSNRADVVFALRDYFRRLGFDAAVEQATVVRMLTNLPDDEVTDYVFSWGRINRVGVSLERASEPSASELAAVAPATEPVFEPAALEPASETATPMPADLRPRLGELLILKGFITKEQLASALIHARTLNVLLGVVLLQ